MLSDYVQQKDPAIVSDYIPVKRGNVWLLADPVTMIALPTQYPTKGEAVAAGKVLTVEGPSVTRAELRVAVTMAKAEIAAERAAQDGKLVIETTGSVGIGGARLPRELSVYEGKSKPVRKRAKSRKRK